MLRLGRLRLELLGKTRLRASRYYRFEVYLEVKGDHDILALVPSYAESSYYRRVGVEKTDSRL